MLIDVSGSMASAMSNRSTAQRWELAALFGAAVGSRADDATLVAFASDSHRIDVRRGDSVLRAIDRVKPFVGGGTETFAALRRHYDRHDRVVILTDEQAFPAYGYRGNGRAEIPADDIDAPIYTFNLAGYAVGHLPSGERRRYAFGGLTDRGFAAIEMIERGEDADWEFVRETPATTHADEDDAIEATA